MTTSTVTKEPTVDALHSTVTRQLTVNALYCDDIDCDRGINRGSPLF